MNIKICLLVVFVFMGISCSETGNSKSVISQTYETYNPVKIETPAPEEINVKSPALFTKGDEQIIYTVVLGKIFRDEDVDKLDYKARIAYRRETIPPSGIEQIEKNPDVSKYLIDNFKQANQKTELLDKEYGVKRTLFYNSGDRDLVKFFKATKRKNPYTDAVVSLSNIGVDQNSSQALVYIEYYRPEAGLIKFYYLMKFGRMDEDIGISGINEVYDLKLIKVN